MFGKIAIQGRTLWQIIRTFHRMDNDTLITKKSLNSFYYTTLSPNESTIIKYIKLSMLARYDNFAQSITKAKI